jgi:hypothetical protein
MKTIKPFAKCDSMRDVFNVYDSMKGRALAAEEQLAGLKPLVFTCPFDGEIWLFHTQEQLAMLQKHLDWHANREQNLTDKPKE